MTDYTNNDIHAIRHDVNSLRQAFKNHQIITDEKLDSLEKNMTRIITLLEGDQADRKRGFISRLEAVEEFMKAANNTKMYFLGNMAAAVFVITFLGALAAFIFQVYDFFNKVSGK